MNTNTGSIASFHMDELVDQSPMIEETPIEMSVKPTLSKGWPLLLVVAFLSCVALLFISEIEWKIVTASVSLSLIVIALSKIFGHDKALNDWRALYAAQMPVEEEEQAKPLLKKKNIRKRTVSLKKK